MPWCLYNVPTMAATKPFPLLQPDTWTTSQAHPQETDQHSIMASGNGNTVYITGHSHHKRPVMPGFCFLLAKICILASMLVGHVCYLPKFELFQSDPGSIIMNVSTKFDITPLSGLSRNAWKPISVRDGQMSVLHIWYKYQVKLDAPHSAPT